MSDEKNNPNGFSILMADVLKDLSKRPPYTKKEILQKEYPEFWGGASECIRCAKELQKMVLEMISHPLFGKIKLCSFEQFQEQESVQEVFLDYLKWLSVYGLAYKTGNIIDDQCRNLAKAKNSADKDGVETAKIELINEMSFVEKITNSLDLIGDNATGFSNLEELIATAPFHRDFLVLTEGSWRYSDIVGVIKNPDRLQKEALWNSFVKNNDPTEPNVNGLMEKPEDDKLVRIY